MIIRTRHVWRDEPPRIALVVEPTYEEWPEGHRMAVITQRCKVCREKWGSSCIYSGEIGPEIMPLVLRQLNQSLDRAQQQRWCYPDPRIRRVVHWWRLQVMRWEPVIYWCRSWAWRITHLRDRPIIEPDA